MKKLVILINGCLSLLIGFSCGSRNQLEREREDSIRRADSLAMVETAIAQAKLDSILKDSLLNIQAQELYRNAITIESVNKSKQPVPETSFYKVEWTCSIKNNTKLRFSTADYQVVYDETFEDGNADELFEVTRQRSVRGIDLPPDSVAEIVLIGRANTQDLSNAAIRMLISEEDFISLFKKSNRALK